MSIISWRYWHWTHSEENLFLLDKDQLDYFKKFVDEALKET